MAYSGPWAEQRWRYDRRPTQHELLAVLGCGGDSDSGVLLAAGGSAAGAAVVPLIERCWPAICKVAAKIVADAVARHRDVCAGLGSSPDPATCALELAHIRAGSVPGSFTVTRAVAA